MRQDILCDICGSSESRVLFDRGRGDEQVINVICLNCGLVFVNPRKSKDGLEEHYTSGSYSFTSRGKYPSMAKFHQSEQMALGRLNILDSCLSPAAFEQKRLLDIGCGVGSFLWMMKKAGWDVLGIEPDTNYAQAGEAKYQVPIKAEMFEEAVLDSSAFDMVCLFHVIEHVASPRNILTRIRDVLKADGTLFLETPCIERPYGDNLEDFFWSEHLYTFSRNTMQGLLKIVGFEIIQTGYSGNFLWVLAKKSERSGMETTALPFDNPDKVWRQTLRSHWWFRNKQRLAPLRHMLSLSRRMFVILRDRPDEFIPALRRKVQSLRKYLCRPKIVSLSIDDLIFPNRLDIWLRVMFLRAYDDAQGNLEVAETPYYIFRVDLARRAAWAPSAEESIQRFLAVYKSIQSSGYVRDNARDDYVKVVRLGGRLSRDGPPYALLDGAHRLAVLKHLGYKTADCCVVDKPFTPPDYTSSILSKDYAQFDAMKHTLNDWHASFVHLKDTFKYGEHS
jgi:2-polyprenyl-3-methyl-5-hydroxy-6-metoxy-1,4-benzoquinol methylase